MVAVWLFGLAALALLVALGIHLSSVKPRVNKAQITFNETTFRAVIDLWKPQQLAKVRSHFRLDYAFLIAYGGFGLALALELLRRVDLPVHFLSVAWPWMLPVAAVCDALENILHQRFLRSERGASPPVLFLVSGCAASVKWLLVGFYLVVLLAWLWVARNAP